MDETDLRILELLRKDARLSFREIGKELKLSTGTVSERVKRMQASRVIRGFFTAVDPESLGLRVTLMLAVRADPAVTRLELGKRMREVGEIFCIHFVTGDNDLMLLVRCRDQEHAMEVLDRIRLMECVRAITSHLVLRSCPSCGECNCECGLDERTFEAFRDANRD